MSNLNKVMLIGRLGKDPDVQNFDSGAMKVSFPLATSDNYTAKDGTRVENTDWHNIVMWRKLAEIASKYLVKGKLVYIEGKIKTRSWEDKDGGKKYITEILADSFQMLGSREESNSQSARPVANSTVAEPAAVSNDAEEDLDDLPF